MILIFTLLLVIIGIALSAVISFKYRDEINREEKLPPLKYREELTRKLLSGQILESTTLTFDQALREKHKASLFFTNKQFQVVVLVDGKKEIELKELLLDELILKLPFQTRFSIFDFWRG